MKNSIIGYSLASPAACIISLIIGLPAFFLLGVQWELLALFCVFLFPKWWELGDDHLTLKILGIPIRKIALFSIRYYPIANRGKFGGIVLELTNGKVIYLGTNSRSMAVLELELCRRLSDLDLATADSNIARSQKRIRRFGVVGVIAVIICGLYVVFRSLW